MPYDSFINNDDDNNNQQPPQNVQNERKISNHLALNHPNYRTAFNVQKILRNKRDTNNFYDDRNQLYEDYSENQNDGKFLFH